MKNTIIIILILVILGVGYYFITKPATIVAPTAPVTTDVQPTNDMTGMNNMPASTATSAQNTQPTPAPAPVVSTTTTVTTAPPQKAAIAIQNFAFSPATMTVKAGTTITWTNDDSASHTVTSDSGSTLASSMIATGQSYSHTFSTPGTYPYHCSVHPTMHGTITVTS